MTDVVKANLNKYFISQRSKCHALSHWIELKMKNFKLIDALYCIYMYAGGDFNEMTKIISQITEKKKVFGRAQGIQTDADVNQIDIIKGVDGKLQLKGYNPDKEPIAKGQHMPRNPKIFRKSDNMVSKTYQNSEEKIMNLGQQVMELYPGESNIYITHAMQAIKRYADMKKISPDKVVNGLKKGRLKLMDDDYNSFEIVTESRTIVIRESTLNELSGKLRMTEYRFYNNIKKFLSQLLADPINATPGMLLQYNGFTRSKLISLLTKMGVIEASNKISDKDENGMPKEATMMVSYKVPKKNLDRKLNRLWIRMFERNLPKRKHKETEINEEGEGALSADASGEILQPVFPMVRRKMPTEMEEATATTTAGNYEYDVPFVGDEETLARKNGVGGSVSVNKV